MATIVDNKRSQIIQFFLDNPTQEVHLRSLSRKLKISPTWIAKVIPEFKEMLVIRKDKERKITLMKANRDSTKFIEFKRSNNLSNIYESNLIEELVQSYQRPEAIVLFGSYSKGEDIEQSDIDIGIVTDKKIVEDWTKYEKRLKRKITIKELKRKSIPLEFMNTLANGITLYGFLDVRL
jgi:predicted nucleotidyltransferase